MSWLSFRLLLYRSLFLDRFDFFYESQGLVDDGADQVQIYRV